MSPEKETLTNWQLEHYAAVGKEYGKKAFTEADGEFTKWVLSKIAEVKPDAQRIAEVGAGTCVFASLLAKKLSVQFPVVCFEPVSQLLEAAVQFENVSPFNGGAIEFVSECKPSSFDFVFTKDTAHHFPTESLDEIHNGIRQKLLPGGRYLMVVRRPPNPSLVPVGTIAAARWESLYTTTDALMQSLRRVEGWDEVSVTQWDKSIDTPLDPWLEGIAKRDTWSVFSSLSQSEIDSTIEEVRSQFGVRECVGFMHQYDVAVFERNQ